MFNPPLSVRRKVVRGGGQPKVQQIQWHQNRDIRHQIPRVEDTVIQFEILDTLNGEANILQSWQNDFPVAQLKLLPEKQREQAVGFMNDAKNFKDVWKAFKPGEAVPDIDFKANLVLFVRNTQFYNRISIGKVKVKDGVAEVLAMETMSAMPIEDKVAMSLVVVPREGTTAIQSGDKIIPIN